MVSLKIFTFQCLLSALLAFTHRYIQLPFSIMNNHTYSHFTFDLLIQNTPRTFDLCLSCHNDTIRHIPTFPQPLPLNLSYGVLNYISQQSPSPYLSFWKKIKSKVFYWLRDLLPRQAWIDLSLVLSDESSFGVDEKVEGRVGLGYPTSSSFVNSLKKYNYYFQYPSFGFRLHDDQMGGDFYLGGLPSEIHISPLKKIKIFNQHQQKWKTYVNSIKIDQQEIFSVQFDVDLSLNHRTFTLPKSTCRALIQALPSCSFSYVQTQSLLSCPSSVYVSLKDKYVQLLLTRERIPLKLRLSSFWRQQSSETVILNVEEGEEGSYNLGQVILKQYVVDFDYRHNQMLLGARASDVWIDRNLFFLVLVGGNLLCMLFWVGALWLVPRPESQAVCKQPEPSSLSKQSGYQLANLSQQCPAQQD